MMANTLAAHRYGKSQVCLLKVDKELGKHVVHDYTVQVLLEGDFGETYTTGDNSKVVPTDTIKNTVYIVAHNNKFSSPEEFGMQIGRHFLQSYSWVSRVNAKVEQNLWQRMEFDAPHEHSFSKGSSEIRTTTVVTSRTKSVEIESGLKNLILLKTTGSGFVGYHKDKHTTLQETTDRIFSTAVTCKWKYSNATPSTDFNKIWDGARKIIFERFALEYSKSVQETLLKTGDNILQAFSDIEEIRITMPNKHAFQFNLSPFGLTNNNTIFQPIRDPAGFIEGTVRRNKAKL